VGAVLPDPDLKAGSQVFTINPDGSARLQLTHVKAPAEAGDPNYSPSGRRIAYVSNAGGPFQVWVMRADGSNQHQLVRDPGHDAFLPRWSPDGRHLVFTRCTQPFGFIECTIATVGARGKHLRDLTGGHWAEFDARYSPDGRTIAFSSNREGFLSVIWQLASGHRPRPLTDPDLEALWPDYTPDGQTILFTNNFDRPLSHLFTMNADGGSVHQLTHGALSTQFGSYSPDGTRIVLDRGIPGGEVPGDVLATVNADGTGLRTVVKTGSLTLADWGPQS
jgi:Tol biopolymer transport system component